MRYLYLTLIILTLISCSGSVNSDKKILIKDWGIFRGDVAMSGYTPIDLPERPSLLWDFKSGSRTSSSPIICDGTVYWCDKRGGVIGIDSQGKLSFEYNFATAVEATPMILDSVLYVGRIDGIMSALSLTKRDTLWNFETMGQISASPNHINFGDSQAIIFGSYDHLLYCIDANNGRKINSYPSGYYINGAVARMGKHIIYGGCDSWVRVIDAETGLQTDSLLTEAYVPSSPAVESEWCYIADYVGNIYELKIEHGKITAHKKIVESKDDSSSYVSVPTVTESDLLVFSGQNILAIDRKNGTIRWKYLLKGAVGESSPVVCNNKVIVCSKTGVISIVDVKNGKLLWEYDTGEQVTASPAVIDGRFYILSAKGTLFCFEETEK